MGGSTSARVAGCGRQHRIDAGPRAPEPEAGWNLRMAVIAAMRNRFASEPVALGRNDPDFGPAGDSRRPALRN
jgi:hypothetical protein